MRSGISDPEFEQLVRRTLTDVAATTRVDQPGELRVGRRSTMGSIWLRAAVALLVVAGVGGLIVMQREAGRPPEFPYASAVDPSAHLFVLPADRQGLVLSDGWVATTRPDDTDGAVQDRIGFLMGTGLSNGAFSDLVQVTTVDEIPDDFGSDGTSEIDTSTGPAIVDEKFGYRLAQQRGEVWLVLSAGEGTPRLVDALAQVTIGPGGTPVLEDGPMSIIEEFERSSITVDYSTYYEAADTASDIRFVVETASTSSAIALGGYTFTTAQPTSVNGTPAWLLTRDGDPPGGIEAAVVWRATPNRIVAISAHTQIEVVEAMAERLQAVSAEEWSTALPEAVVED